jgi:hypothetical protein
MAKILDEKVKPVACPLGGAHHFERLSDTAIYCPCGEIRQVTEQECAGCQHWHPTWIYYPPLYPNTWTTSSSPVQPTVAYLSGT